MRGHKQAARVTTAAALVLVAWPAVGCGSRSDAGAARDPVVLRVAAPAGLGRFLPSKFREGSTAAALDLVYEPLGAHARILSVKGRVVTLQLIPASRLSSEQLAETIRFETIEEVRVVDDARIAVVLSTADDAELFDRWAAVDVGPFRLDTQAETSVRLVRRGESAIGLIEIVEMTSEEEERRMLGRRLDVIPSADQNRRQRFEGMDSVRILDYPEPHETVLVMNVRNPALSDVAVRRRLARALDRTALSRVACGTGRCEARPTLPPAVGHVEMPESLRLRVQLGDTDSETLARAVRTQLRRAEGIEVVMEVADMVGSPDLVASVDAQLTLTPITTGKHRYELFVSPDDNKLYSASGYANPDYDTAVARGDLTAAQRMLDRDVPVTPLVVRRSFAVIDERFCGDPELSETSWRWLAELRPCRPGQAP